MFLGKTGKTDLFIRPGFQFQRTNAMLTNFHLPQSSLLMLVCAFAGREFVLAAYQHAVECGLSFLFLRRLYADLVTQDGDDDTRSPCGRRVELGRAGRILSDKIEGGGQFDHRAISRRPFESHLSAAHARARVCAAARAAGPVAPKAHDMAREYMVLKAVHPFFRSGARSLSSCARTPRSLARSSSSWSGGTGSSCAIAFRRSLLPFRIIPRA